MNIDALIDHIFSRVRKTGAAAEIFFESSETRPAEFDANQLKYLGTRSHRGIGLRVIHNGRIGFSSTSDLDRIDELVRNAIESAQFGQPARFEFPAACSPAAVNVFDPAVERVTTEQMVSIGQQAIDAILKAHPDVHCSAEIDVEQSDELIANTRGLRVGHTATGFSFSISALAVDDSGLTWAEEWVDSCRFQPDTRPLVAKIIRDLDASRAESHIDTGTWPAIFTPDAMATLIYTIAEGINGKIVQKGASPLTGRIGTQVLDPRITIIDDALIDYAAASAPHDTEGLASRRTPLFANGVLASFILDLQTAGMLNAQPTGNGIRSSTSLPAPGNNNIIVTPGDVPVDDMVRSIKRGLIIDKVLGSGMSNTLAGEFSLNVQLGFLIEDGRVCGRVKDCMLSGNVYELLKSGVAAVGDFAELKGALSVPAVCFKGVSVGT